MPERTTTAVTEVLLVTMALYLDDIARQDPSRHRTEVEMPEQMAAYARRNATIVAAVSTAMQLGWPAGFKANLDDPEWPVAYIDLPDVGQVSWHIPAYPGQWDRHTVDEKYARVRDWLAAFDASTKPADTPRETWDHPHPTEPGEH